MGTLWQKVRIIAATSISYLPCNFVRVQAYRLLFQYIIVNSKIGWGSVICVDSAKIQNAIIDHKNKFIGPYQLTIRSNTYIGTHNTFECGWWTLESQFTSAGYTRNILIGENCLITHNHHFDIAGSIWISNNTWIAGKGSQFWTHGAKTKNRDIRIGENCYIGSAVLFAPGSQIPNNSIVSLGSVVTQKFVDAYVLIGGNPAQVLRKKYDWKNRKQI